MLRWPSARSIDAVIVEAGERVRERLCDDAAAAMDEAIMLLRYALLPAVVTVAFMAMSKRIYKFDCGWRSGCALPD